MGFYSSLFIVYSLFIIHNLFIVYCNVPILVMNIHVCCVAEILLTNQTILCDFIVKRSICYFHVFLPCTLVIRYVFVCAWEGVPFTCMLFRCYTVYVINERSSFVTQVTFYMCAIHVFHMIRFQ